MAFTTLEIVKKHLLGTADPALLVENVPVTLSGTEPAALPDRHLIEKSESVKQDVAGAPECDGPITLSGTDWIALSYARLVPGTVVTLGPTLQTVFTEEVDYQVDVMAGQIRRVEGGAIPDPSTVYLYSYVYTIFEAETDYLFDAEAGTVRRVGGSAIPDGARVLVDYTRMAGSVDDELILEAITEAHDRVVGLLSPSYNGSSPDQGLKTGETELVLAVLARAMALLCLTEHVGSDGGTRAREWQNLAGLYETRGWQILRPFLDPYTVHAPEKKSNE